MTTQTDPQSKFAAYANPERLVSTDWVGTASR